MPYLGKKTNLHHVCGIMTGYTLKKYQSRIAKKVMVSLGTKDIQARMNESRTYLDPVYDYKKR